MKCASDVYMICACVSGPMLCGYCKVSGRAPYTGPLKFPDFVFPECDTDQTIKCEGDVCRMCVGGQYCLDIIMLAVHIRGCCNFKTL